MDEQVYTVEWHQCNAMGKGDKQVTAGRLHTMLLPLFTITGYGWGWVGSEGALQVSDAAARGQVYRGL